MAKRKYKHDWLCTRKELLAEKKAGTPERQELAINALAGDAAANMRLREMRLADDSRKELLG